MVHVWAKQKGFTIVELLIVIVVIGILAAIVIVAYNGVQNRARISALQSDLSNAKKTLELSRVEVGTYPTSTTALKASANTNYELTTDNATNPQTFCLTATNGSVSYSITGLTPASAGACPGHSSGGIAAVTNLMYNPSIESSSSGWAMHGALTGGRMSVGGKWVYQGTRNATGATAMYLGQGAPSPVVSGDTYTASALVTSSVTQSINMIIRPGGSNSNLSSTPYTLVPNVPQRISTNAVMTTGSAYVTVFSTSGSVNDMITVDEVMLTAGPTVYGYGDGSTAGWTWNGSPNNSTSTGPGQ